MIRGYALLWDTPSIVPQEGRGIDKHLAFHEQFSPRAFREQLASDAEIKCLLSHSGPAVATLSNGGLRLREDWKGLYVEVDLGHEHERHTFTGWSISFSRPTEEDSCFEERLPTDINTGLPGVRYHQATLGEISFLTAGYTPTHKTEIARVEIDPDEAFIRRRAVVAERMGVHSLRSIKDDLEVYRQDGISRSIGRR
jgi:phage head maturation protease